MNVLIICEISGVVRRAFAKRGHAVTSIDVLPALDRCTARWHSYGAGTMRHWRCDAREVHYASTWYDLMIAFPPCTHLAGSGARHWPAKQADGRQQAALDFVRFLMDRPIDCICIENPVGIISTAIRKPTQVISPNQFGHNAYKRTCLWLKNLPKLEHTDVRKRALFGRWDNRTHDGLDSTPQRPSRAMNRSITYAGIAAAMAEQWGQL